MIINVNSLNTDILKTGCILTCNKQIQVKINPVLTMSVVKLCIPSVYEFSISNNINRGARKEDNIIAIIAIITINSQYSQY